MRRVAICKISSASAALTPAVPSTSARVRCGIVQRPLGPAAVCSTISASSTVTAPSPSTSPAVSTRRRDAPVRFSCLTARVPACIRIFSRSLQSKVAGGNALRSRFVGDVRRIAVVIAILGDEGGTDKIQPPAGAAHAVKGAGGKRLHQLHMAALHKRQLGARRPACLPSSAGCCR